ncbi:hypothetical protein SNEBB_001876 [Seison nebaliae]|nr:hypothetical protein SNEBB_001876 [Seison nebaliae]
MNDDEKLSNNEKEEEVEEEEVQERFNINNWDAMPMLEEIYSVKDETINYVKNLPTNSNFNEIVICMNVLRLKDGGNNSKFETVSTSDKDRLLNTWQNVELIVRRSTTVTVQWSSEKECYDVMNGQVEIVERANCQMLIVTDGKGHRIIVRMDCSDGNNSTSLEELCELLKKEVDPNNFYYRLANTINQSTSIEKPCVLIELGSSNIRAGLIEKKNDERIILPQFFQPALIGIDNDQQMKFGKDVLDREFRQKMKRSFSPFQSSPLCNLQSNVWSYVGEMISFIVDELMGKKCFDEFDICVGVSIRYNDEWMTKLATTIFEYTKCDSLSLLLSTRYLLHDYKCNSSGVTVHLGDQLIIEPTVNGLLLQHGITSMKFGGEQLLMDFFYRTNPMNTTDMTILTRFILKYFIENLCSFNSKKEEENVIVKELLEKLKLTESKWNRLKTNNCENECVEGLFEPELWNCDIINLPKLIKRALMATSIDDRPILSNNIYLSGGLSLIPGLIDRLEMELDKLFNSTLTIKIFRSPNSYHSSFISIANRLRLNNGQIKFMRRKSFNDSLKCIDSVKKRYLSSIIQECFH